jgi:RNA polymerase sigma factor (sigma-70 family)
MSQEKLYRQFYPGLFALCKKFFDDNDDIITALNNGMLNVYRNIEQYDVSKGELFNWAYAIVRNSALTLLRNNRNKVIYKEISKEVEYTTQFNPFTETDHEDIIQYLDMLPPSTRKVVAQFYLDGFSIKEIAEKMKLNEGTIKWHLNEGRTKLKYFITKNA